MTDEELTFETATQELDSILEKLDGDDVNIDSLAVDLERASELIEWCRARFETTRVGGADRDQPRRPLGLNIDSVSRGVGGFSLGSRNALRSVGDPERTPCNSLIPSRDSDVKPVFVAKNGAQVTRPRSFSRVDLT